MMKPVIFEEFGYSKELEQDVDTDDDGRRTYKVSARKKLAERDHYPYGVDWSHELLKSIQEYSEINQEAIQLIREIDAMEERKKKESAQKLWDSIE